MKKYLLLLGSALVLAACGSPSDVEVSEEASSTAAASSEVASAVSEETVSAPGKRSNPVAVGQSATWDLVYYDAESNRIDGVVTASISNVVRGEEAYNQLIAANPYNEAAPEGFEWVIFDLKATLDEGSADDPFNTVNLSITPVASDGSEVAQPFYATFETGTDFGFKDLYKGGTDEGKKGLIVPVGDETLVEITDWNTSVFFKLN